LDVLWANARKDTSGDKFSPMLNRALPSGFSHFSLVNSKRKYSKSIRLSEAFQLFMENLFESEKKEEKCSAAMNGRGEIGEKFQKKLKLNKNRNEEKYSKERKLLRKLFQFLFSLSLKTCVEVVLSKF
jgi:hypothetical protein